jgi:macrolide transport system ATP-binding/permease protein
MMDLLRDLRFALRMLRKQPGFTAVMVVALALGIGICTSVFGAVNVFLLRPLPVKDPEQLADVFLGPEDQPRVWGDLSYGDYVDLSRESEVFSGLAAASDDSGAFGTGEAHVVGNAEPAGFEFWAWVSGNYFDVLGVQPLLGRTFTPEEGAVPGQAVLVLSHELWKRRFHEDPTILGRRVYVNTTPFVVIGVMPPSFRRRFQLGYWVPLGARIPFGSGDSWTTDRTQRDLSVIGRLRPGVSLEQAGARLNVAARGMAAEHPATNAGTKFGVTSEIEGRYRRRYAAIKQSCSLALLVAGLVLLISCANVANLLLARTAARSRELGVRVALGAGRARVARQLITESVLVAALGGALGLIFALWFGDLLRAFLPPLPFQFTFELEPDPVVFGWAMAVSLLAGVVSGVFPAWRASRADVVSALKTDTAAEGQTLRRAGVRQLLVVGQLAVSVVVVVVGGLFVRSLEHIASLDPGFRPGNLATTLVNPGLVSDCDAAQVRTFFEELTQRVERLPGVESASSVLSMPLINTQSADGPVVKEGDTPPLPNTWKPVSYSVVYPKYFETIGTDLVAGRDFEAPEREGTPSTAIINAELARRLYGREPDAVGKRFRFGGDGAPLLEVVGVAKDGRYESFFEDPTSWIYLPGNMAALHNDGLWTMRTMLVRATSARELPSILEGLHAEVRKLDPRIPLLESFIGEHHLDFALSDARLAAHLGIILGLVALGLATMGMYSVMTYTVSHRTKEIGIRMALGAQVRDVLGLVVGQALRLVAVGVVVGALGALAVANLLRGFLFGVTASDPVSFFAAVALLVTASLVATVIPARRATRVDPMVALRYE